MSGWEVSEVRTVEGAAMTALATIAQIWIGFAALAAAFRTFSALSGLFHGDRP